MINTPRMVHIVGYHSVVRSGHMGRASIQVVGGTWNIIDTIPQQGGKDIEPADDKFTVLVVFSTNPGGGSDGLKVDAADDGDSLFDMNPKRFISFSGHDAVYPDGFA